MMRASLRAAAEARLCDALRVIVAESDAASEPPSAAAVARELLRGADAAAPAFAADNAEDAAGAAALVRCHTGVPVRPLYLPVAREALAVRLRGGTLRAFATLPLLDDVAGIRQRVEDTRGAGGGGGGGGLAAAAGALADALLAPGEDAAAAAAAVAAVRVFVAAAGPLGVLRLVGLRLTLGTVTAIEENALWPPAPGDLRACFNELYPKASSCLTVGAKALAKHTVRHESWWGGDLKGGEAAKAAAAAAVLERILEGTRWMNLHMLPHGKPTFEIRVDEGYGARWAYEPVAGDGGGGDGDPWKLSFRGFLEPQCEDGHENRWRH